jgi:hypothetical protein
MAGGGQIRPGPPSSSSTGKVTVSHHNHGRHGHPHLPPARKGLHKDWRVWAVAGLMLLAMLIYILTLDEARRPW